MHTHETGATVNTGNYFVTPISVCQGCHYKCHRLGGLSHRNALFHSSGGWKSEMGVPVGSIYSATSLSGWCVAVFSLCPHTVVPL